MRRAQKAAWCAVGVAALIALAALVSALCGVFAPTTAAPAPSAALLAVADGLDQTAIVARLEPQHAQLTVSQTLTLTNPAPEPLDAAVLRTWPNAFQNEDTTPASDASLYGSCYPEGFSAGALTVTSAALVRPDGESPIPHRYTDEAKTALSLPVAGGWQVGETLTFQLTYTVTVPRMAYRFGVHSGVWALGNAFAWPAVYEDGAFRTDAYAPVGDPFVSDPMNVTLSLTVPAGYRCAGSALTTVETDGSLTTYRFTAPAVRDFALVVSDRFETVQRVQDGVMVTAFATDTSRANALLDSGCRALAFFSEQYGAYPYPAYTLAEISFPMGGMEYPALSMIAKSQLDAGERATETIVAHETAHQWWYAVVGSDQWRQAWQDEALCEFGTLGYLAHRFGPAARAEAEQRKLMSLRVTVPRGVTPGAPLDRFSTMAQYVTLVYDRGCALLMAMDDMLPDGLTPFLRAYYQRYAFTRATRTDFEALLRRVTGEDLAPLMRDYLDTYIQN